MSRVADVAIIGGGVAGATAAYHCAQAGLRSVLLEKELEPSHKVCGEFISAEGLPLIAEMGIDLSSLGAVAIDRFRLHGPRRSSERALPAPAMGLSRQKLDSALLSRAEEAGCELKRGVLVRGKSHGLGSSRGAIVLETSVGEVAAHRLIVASGKHEFRSLHARVGRDSGLVGFKMHLSLKPTALADLGSSCDLFVFEGGYGGLSPIENGRANFCFLVEKKALRSIGGDWASLSSHIARQNWAASRYLDGAIPLFRHLSTVANIPYGFVREEPIEPGVFCVGDQMAVIPSLTGDGMTIALHTAREAALSLASPERAGRLRPAFLSLDYHRRVARTLRPQVDMGFYLHQLFKRPRLCDLATHLVGLPRVTDTLFRQTRCRLAEGLTGENRLCT